MSVRDQFDTEAARLRDAARTPPKPPYDARWAAAIPVARHAWVETAALLGEQGVPTVVVDGRDLWAVPYRYARVFLTRDGHAWMPVAAHEQGGPPQPVVLTPLALLPEPNFGLQTVPGQWELTGDGTLLAFIGDNARDVPQYEPLDTALAAFVGVEVRRVSARSR
ncbi:hypothetical protein [Curtobacterium sp. MCSS17_016]|uniref:hypothetical protein n=1 Tax=Curtobacterium sp. MCSS17_016 TaxID=2175644 RepID=UPI0011B5D549|nr:hypothetical protein [Curtobacterium sp. MCSS17_016]WIE80902.1 hypothetical protein DEJ19_020510 [Curtobacterium sp. MCSS17_016]